MSLGIFSLRVGPAGPEGSPSGGPASHETLSQEGDLPNWALYFPMTSLTANGAGFSRLAGRVRVSLCPVVFLATLEAGSQRLTSSGPVFGVMRPLSCRLQGYHEGLGLGHCLPLMFFNTGIKDFKGYGYQVTEWSLESLFCLFNLRLM